MQLKAQGLTEHLSRKKNSTWVLLSLQQQFWLWANLLYGGVLLRTPSFTMSISQLFKITGTYGNKTRMAKKVFTYLGHCFFNDSSPLCTLSVRLIVFCYLYCFKIFLSWFLYFCLLFVLWLWCCIISPIVWILQSCSQSLFFFCCLCFLY